MSKTESLQTRNMSATAEGLEKALFASIQSKFRKEQPAFLRITKALRKDNASDLISMEEFSRIQKSLWIHLDRVELSYITDTFTSGIEGKMNWTKFVNRLNILPPSDHHEPDRHLDPLPEPLAGIVEILELEIIDRAWLDIIGLHPEIPIDEEGNSLVVRKNRNLEVLCPPSATGKQITGPTATSSDGSVLFSAYEDGSVVVISSRSGEEKHAVPVFRELVRSRSQPFSVVILSNTVSVPSDVGVPISRVAICVLYESVKPVEEIEVAAPAKKAAAKGKGAVVEEVAKPAEREFILHVKIVETVESESGSRSVGIKVLTKELVCNISTLDVTVDLCCDGMLLTICHTSRCGVYHVSELPMVDPMVGGPSLAQVPEEKATFICDDAAAFELVLVSVLQLGDVEAAPAAIATDSNKEASKPKFQKVYSFTLPEFSGRLPNEDIKTSTKAVTNPRAVMSKYALIVISNSSSNLLMLGFSPQITTSPAPIAVPDKKAVLPPAEATPDRAAGLLSTYRMHSWMLTAPITASLLDAPRQTMALGAADGTVTLWDIPNRALLSVCGKHSACVTALCFAEGVSNFILSSGAADGTVCFYTMRRGETGIFEAATNLVDVRQDVPKASVCSLDTLGHTSIIICIFSDGVIAAYEAEAAELIGKLVLYVGMMAQKMDSRPISVFDMLQSARSKHGHWLMSSQPSMDDGESSEVGAVPAVPDAVDRTPKADSANPIDEFFNYAKGRLLSGTDANGLCVIFSDVPKGSGSNEVDVVRASFTTNSVIENLHPGIAALIKTNTGPQNSGPVPSAIELYRMLSLAERKNPLVSRASIQYVNSVPSTASAIENEPKKVRQKKTQALTEANLNAHGNSDLIFKAPAPKLGSVHISTVRDSNSLGISLLKDLRERPDAQKQNKKIANRIKNLCSILPAS